MIKTIFIDVGQIFVSVDFGGAAARIYEKSDKRMEEISLYFKNAKNIADYGLGKIDTRVFLRNMKNDLNYKGSSHELSMIWGDIFKPIPQNIEIAKNLRKRYQLIASSNTNPLHAKQIAKLGIYCLFDKCVFSHRVGARKPDKKYYVIALRKSKADVEESIFIDDSTENVKAAKKMGFKAERVQEPQHLKEVLIRLGVAV